MHKIGFANPRDIVGKVANGNPIIGVVRDFHTASLHAIIGPTAIVCDAKKLNSFGVRLGVSKENPEKLAQTLTKIEGAWKDIYSDKFEFSFIDDRIANYYRSEQRINKVASVGAGIAVLISCLGLFALASFDALERTKEIGIRKVMGASVNGIVILLSSKFLKLVLIAFMFSAPIAFYLSDKWLNGFAFRMDLSIWVFLVAGIFSAALAFVTISFRTIQTANTDPVKSLRYE